MKVFCFENTDWVAAESKDEAIEFWVEETGGMIEDSFVEEASLTDKMWYGFDLGDKKTQEILDKMNRNFLMRKNFRGYPVAVELTFEEVIKIDNITKPCIISSTEW